MPWTAARTTECYGNVRSALRSSYRTTQLLSQPLCRTVTKTMSVAPPLGNNWSKSSPAFKPSSTSLLLISSGLTWGSSTTTLVLISPGPAKAFNFFVRVQLTSLLLISPGLCDGSGFENTFISPETHTRNNANAVHAVASVRNAFGRSENVLLVFNQYVYWIVIIQD